MQTSAQAAAELRKMMKRSGINPKGIVWARNTDHFSSLRIDCPNWQYAEIEPLIRQLPHSNLYQIDW